MTDLDALLEQARLPERTVPLCLRGDLQACFEQLERDLDEAEQNTGDKLTDGSKARELAEQIEALREQMRASTVTFTLRALPREEWAALVAEHPAEDGTPYSYNPVKIAPVLVRKSIIDPVLSDKQWNELNKVLSDGQFGELADTAAVLNRRPVDIPFSQAASHMLQTSEPTSRRRRGSASR